MIIHVRVKTNSSEQRMIKFGDNRYLIYLKGKPENNEANIELLNFLSKYFSTPVKNIKFKTGMHSQDKMLEVG